MDPSIFRQDIDNIEYSPKILAPSSYVKVRSKNKRTREFDKLFLAQELRLHDTPIDGSKTRPTKGDVPDQDAVWTMAFSSDGHYFAAAGQNNTIKVWAVLSNLTEREAQEAGEDGLVGPESRTALRASVFKSTPVRSYADHDGPVLDLSWSKVRQKFTL
jgi:WD40 repeat protein